MQVLTILCPYCGGDALFKTTSRHLYRQDYGPVYDCRPCNAYVGATWDGTPKGTLANKELRELRKECHRKFDVLWQGDLYEGEMTRSQAYAWLAKEMGLPSRKAHIGQFDTEQCKLLLTKLGEKK